MRGGVCVSLSSSLELATAFVPAAAPSSGLLFRLRFGLALALVLGFGSSAALGGAYGLAVSGAMTIVTPLTLSLIKSRTGKDSRVLRTGLSLLFIVDIAFLLANLTKHHKEVAEHVVGTVVVDAHHQTEGQLLAQAREFFASKGA